MKTLTFISLFLLSVAGTNVSAQETVPASSSPEKYGKTLNLGVGVGYYGYVGHSLPLGTLNFEFDVARNFTLAPFAGIYSYRNYYYWGNPNKPYEDISYRQYAYRVTAVPVGLKGTYYFDELFGANKRWDFYAAGSLGFVFRSVTWENDYYGDRRVYKSASPLYLDAHIGAELHLNPKAGLFLDLSTGVSTFGLAIHF
jgi:hypothetical protein